MTDADLKKRRRAARVTALILAVIVVAIYAGFILSTAR